MPHSSRIPLAILALTVWASPSFAESPDRDYRDEILAVDKDVFTRGYNECDISAFETSVSEDFEFYHDLGGITDGKEAFVASIQRAVCGEGRTKLYRRLIPGTSQVYPLQSGGELYGAIQMGDHSFHSLDEDGAEIPDSTASFITSWTLEDDQWRMHRIFSYDHHLYNERPAFLNTGYPAPLFDRDDDIEALMGRLNVPTLAIARIESGMLQQVRVFGSLDDGSAAPMNARFKVASLTKPITAALTLRLVEQGEWDLDSPLSRYHTDPDLKGDRRQSALTTRHVLSHRSGLPNWRYLTETNKLAFEFEPGAKQQYSGEGFEFLRKALEAKFGKPLEVIAKEQLFDPLGMNDTHFYWTDHMSEATYAAPSGADGKPIDEAKHKTANAAANLLTTVEDYAKFSIFVLEGAGLSDPLNTQMLTPSDARPGQIPFGLGWEIVDGIGAQGPALQHTGSDEGVKTIVLLMPETQDGLIVFTNANAGIALYAKIVEESLSDAGPLILKRNLERE